MQNFVFHNPTKVIFGKKTLPLTGSETASWGKRALLVSGLNSAQRSGLLEQIRHSLQAADVDVIEFSSVLPNPTVEKVRQGIERAKQEKIDVLCAIGGGSVIDTAKAIAAGALVNHDVWKFFTGKKSVKQALPVIAVSTLAASGSEMNSGMVLTNQETRQKFGFAHRYLFPKTAIMDPETTYSVNPEYTAYGAIDAFAHLLEFYMTNTQAFAIIQERYMEGLARSIVVSCNKALANPFDYEARASLMWAAGLTLNGLSSAGLGKVGFPMHLIEHSLSAMYDIPHGAGLSVVIPGWLRYAQNQLAARISVFLTQAFDVQSQLPIDASGAIDLLTDWFKQIGAPTSLADIQLLEKDVAGLAENAQALARVWRMREYSQDIIEDILKRCL